MILTQSYLKGVNTGYNSKLKTALDALADIPSLARLICEETDGKGVASVEYNFGVGMPILTELIGEAGGEMSNLSTAQFTVANKVFQRLIELRKEDLERGQSQIYMPTIQRSATAWSIFKDARLATKLVAGFTTEKSYAVGAPAFFSNNQVLSEGKPGKVSNTVTKKLSAANFEIAVESMRSRVDSENNPMNLGNKMVLVVGPRNESLAKSIVKADKLASGAYNPNEGMAELLVWNFLSVIKPDAWFLFDTAYGKPCIYQTEVPLATYMQTNPEDTNVMKSGKFLYQLYHRGDLALADPLLAYGSDGSTAA